MSRLSSHSDLVFGAACWYLHCTSAGGPWAMGYVVDMVVRSGGGGCAWQYGCPAKNRASQSRFWSGVCGFASHSCG
jgi:hypothetical protein